MIKLQYVLPRKEGLKLKNNNRKGSFLESAFILTISTAFVKLAGLLFTIPISNMLGGEGMGYFYAAYDIYNMLADLTETLSSMARIMRSIPIAKPIPGFGAPPSSSISPSYRPPPQTVPAAPLSEVLNSNTVFV